MRKILVVDDNYDNRFIAGEMLSMNGYQVVSAVSGRDALRVLESDRPNLILMDLTMPQMDGWEATRRIKSDPRLSHIPVVAVTSHAVETDLNLALDAGCADYLIKPYDYQALLDKVRDHLV